ncbi:MAG TPA: hypothetical protein VFA25_03035, partial [Actinomycetota bacterium]|nr:hypothetical protein [Actinomycetota bacterium]
YLWSALVSGSALAIGVIDGRVVAGAIVGCALLLFLVTALPRLLERRRNGEVGGVRTSEPRLRSVGEPGAPDPEDRVDGSGG